MRTTRVCKCGRAERRVLVGRTAGTSRTEPVQAHLLLCRREAEAGSPAFMSWALGKLPPRDVELWANDGRAFLLRRQRLPQRLGMRATHPH